MGTVDEIPPWSFKELCAYLLYESGEDITLPILQFIEERNRELRDSGCIGFVYGGRAWHEAFAHVNYDKSVLSELSHAERKKVKGKGNIDVFLYDDFASDNLPFEPSRAKTDDTYALDALLNLLAEGHMKSYQGDVFDFGKSLVVRPADTNQVCVQRGNFDAD